MSRTYGSRKKFIYTFGLKPEVNKCAEPTVLWNRLIKDHVIKIKSGRI